MNLILASDIFITAIALIFLIFASITDIKKREVPDWLSFSLLAIAFAVRIITSLLTHQANYFLSALLSFAIFFIIANIFYYGKLFGGGDAKLLIALSVAFGTIPSFITRMNFFAEPFLFTFTINIFVIGSLYSLISSIFLAAKNKKDFSNEFKNINKNKTMKIVKIFCIAASALFLIASFFINNLTLLFFIFLIVPYLYVFVKAVENSSMIKILKPSELTEGDWLVNSLKIGKKEIKPSVHGLTKEQISLIKKAGKKVRIKYGLPFVPAIFIALIVSLAFGDLILLLINYLL